MTTILYDQRYIEWSLGVLEDYLHTDSLYWPVDVQAPAGESPYPQLSLDSLLLALRRLLARRESPSEGAPATLLEGQVDAVRRRWQVAWENKAKRCFRSRLTLWLNYLDDYRHDPLANSDRYSYEVRHRVFLELLLPELSGSDLGADELLQAPDVFLKAVLVPGRFIWQADIWSGFPNTTFWYLYGTLSEKLPGNFVISNSPRTGDG